MSWIFGYTGRGIPEINEKFNSLLSSSLFQHKSENLSVVCGGINSTCKFMDNTGESDKASWVFSGIAFSYSNFGLNFLTISELDKIINTSGEKIDSGHYVYIKWNENQLDISTDFLGLRDIYILEKNNEIYFSTHPEWLANIFNLGIDFESFSNRWLFFNPIANDSIFHNTLRLVAGSSFTYNFKDKTSAKNIIKAYIPQMTNILDSVDYFITTLPKMLNFNSDQLKLLISFSGGIDSRTIFAASIMNKTQLRETFSFGSPEHPDSLMAKKISVDFGVKHKQYFENNFEVQKLIDELFDYTSYTLTNTPASYIIKLRNYKLIENTNSIVADGGMGELWRAELFIKLKIAGKKYLMNKDIEGIYKILLFPRPDIFNAEINHLMKNSALKSINNLFDILPNINKIGIDNWLDTLAINAQVQNFCCQEQTRLDSIIPAYMPFLQIPLLNCLFSLKYSEKRNAALFKNAIKNYDQLLAKYKLVKNNVMVPYGLTSLQKKIVAYSAARFRLGYSDNYQEIFWNSLKDYINDVFRSQSVLDYENYDKNKIKGILDDFNKNQKGDNKAIDWLLSFETLRKIVYGKF